MKQAVEVVRCESPYYWEVQQKNLFLQDASEFCTACDQGVKDQIGAYLLFLHAEFRVRYHVFQDLLVHKPFLKEPSPHSPSESHQVVA